MRHQTIGPRKALNKAFLKQKPERKAIEGFKAALIGMLDHAKAGESEEYHKNLVSQFLKESGFAPAHYINTKGRNDLVIHTGKDAESPVGVIIEAKRPGIDPERRILCTAHKPLGGRAGHAPEAA
ncbi:MAG: hypothetical protein KDB77_12540, partial [Flavobacteriales bacterium]|nr:hypothetical protein [Flavobacteriales bacterium]